MSIHWPQPFLMPPLGVFGVVVTLPAGARAGTPQWYRDKAEVPPPWSCRSGMSVCLTANTAVGPACVPYNLAFGVKVGGSLLRWLLGWLAGLLACASASCKLFSAVVPNPAAEFGC
jgi:hypothetical protein